MSARSVHCLVTKLVYWVNPFYIAHSKSDMEKTYVYAALLRPTYMENVLFEVNVEE